MIVGTPRPGLREYLCPCMSADPPPERTIAKNPAQGIEQHGRPGGIPDYVGRYQYINQIYWIR
jgi:hypothetical protein